MRGELGFGLPENLEVIFERHDPTSRKSPPERVREVRLSSSAGLTPSELQRFPWRKWLTGADAELRSATPSASGMSWQVDTSLPHAIAKAIGLKLTPEPGLRPGRRGHPREYYERIAKLYEELRIAGLVNPDKQIATELNINASTVRGHISNCRQLGLLPPARRGKAG